MRILYSLIGIVVGFLLIRYSIVITDTLGKIDWAERYLRTGMAGTYTMYRLIGVIFIIFSLMYLFGVFGWIIGPLAPLFGAVK